MCLPATDPIDETEPALTPSKDAPQPPEVGDSTAKWVPMPHPHTGGTSTMIGDLAASSSQAAPASSVNERLNADVAVVERVSRNGGGVERVGGRLVVMPLHVVTNMRVLISDIFRDYPAYRVALPEYTSCSSRIVALRDICQRVAGWVWQEDPTASVGDQEEEVDGVRRRPWLKTRIRP